MTTTTTKLPILRLRDGIDSPELQDEVKLLQTKIGLLADNIDGKFGSVTEIVVKRFQQSKGLLTDGIVGQETWSILLDQPVEVFLPYAQTVGSFNIERIVNSIKFPTIRKYARKSIPLILQECEINGVTERGQIAYILATAQHESHLGELMVELASGNAYENRKDLGNTKPGDGAKFKGRGFVQITGRKNYTDWSTRLGINLIENSEKAATDEIAAKILVQGMRDGAFTSLKLGNFISSTQRDFVNARKIINALDRAKEIAAIAEQFLQIL
ncbi:peptidoglycan-binding protein [Aerosakkonemataceae cyanobacterium BLCC-F50]|uniref:Peptidoglycan-binding protein n=1 Tax=Floridaenema flaviceps BLCC-F50 TaxID=3153642 RepID=A0ABV4Y2U1_9CYAN